VSAPARPIAVVGIGELGAALSTGSLRLGHPIVPILRGDRISERAPSDALMLLVTVAERDLDGVLDDIPPSLRDRVGLVQNELLRRDWERAGVIDPTVAVVWFEKKRGRIATAIRPTPIAGPHAELLVRALRSIDLPAEAIDRDALPDALVRKNLYVIGANLAGLIAPGTTGELAREHRALTIDVLRDVLAIESARVGRTLAEEPLIARALADLELDPEHAATGRSAPERLARALARADAHGLEVPTLRRIARQQRAT
jgi:hypothetical protein